MKKREIISSFIQGFGMPNGDIILHDYPKWSFYPKEIRFKKMFIDGIHSFEFNAIEGSIIYKYLKDYINEAV